MKLRRRGPHRRLLATAAALLLLALLAHRPAAAPAPQARTTDTVVSDGERLYMQGLSSTGAPLDAIVQGDLRVSSTTLPCVNCHKRSGWGTSEGPVTVPAVLGRVLFDPRTVGAAQIGARTTGAGTRPAYTEATLLRALREGLDPAGRALSPTMPRYVVSEADNTALAAFLRSLGAPPPGVTASAIHLATVVAPDVSAAKRASMLDVLRRYVRTLTAETRQEGGRRDRGAWDMKQHYENYREWVLHEWTLEGDPSTWGAQLEALYVRQPVFALLSGLGAGDWSPVHDFSARHRIPAVLAQTPLPPSGAGRDTFYALYFSAGVATEARALANHLDAASPAAGVLQVARCGSAGEAAASTLETRVKSRARVRTHCVPKPASMQANEWRALVRGKTDALVLWLDAADLPALQTLAASETLAGIADVYLSSNLLGQEALRVPAGIAERASLVTTSVPPDEFERHAWRSLAWIKASGLSPADRPVAANAFYAATLVSDVLRMPRVIDSREYFIERIEHMAGRSPIPSAYSSVSFDPVRRIASGGSYIVKMPASPGGPFRKVQPWFVPRS